MEQLSRREVLFVRRLCKIRVSLGRLNEWFYRTYCKVSDGEVGDMGELQSQWAKMKFEELCLKTAEREMFNVGLITDSNIRKRVKEILE